MYVCRLTAALVGFGLSGTVTAQRAYADFQAPLERDNEAVSAKFPDIEGVELLSPSFLNPKNVADGFANGTSTPLSQVDQGMSLRLPCDANN
jgi:hypothetical protein